MAEKAIGLTKHISCFICLMGLCKSVLRFVCYLILTQIEYSLLLFIF